MAQNPETQALLEKALRHVLASQAKLLGHPEAAAFLDGAKALTELASKTWELIAEGFHKIDRTSQLTILARRCEELIDEASEAHWIPMLVSVSAIYERIEQTFSLRPIQEKLKLKAALDVRNHFHNLRIALLGQLLNARMLINNDDYGGELQKIWRDFLQRQLGPGFRVLEGGHIMDHIGNNANAQIDLIVVLADAQILTPSDLEDGKANVLCDQVIAAFMVTSVLRSKKLREDWEKLQRVGDLFKFTDEFPQSKPQAWPLCYVVSGQSTSFKKLEKTWKSLVEEMPDSSFVPQFLTCLDSGYVYSGATSWPRPRYPGNYTERNELAGETEIRAGIGLAWILTQIRARAALVQRRPTLSIQRFAKLLDDAVLRDAVPPTWSSRFDTGFKSYAIKGVFWWGRRSRHAHNRLHLASLEMRQPDGELSEDCSLYRAGFDATKLAWDERPAYLRWFRHGACWELGKFIALEEWTKAEDGAPLVRSFPVFDFESGAEIFLSTPLAEPESIEAVLEALLKREEEV